MAAIPLESSSTPPREPSRESTRSPHDPMEDIHPESTRKRPRLDSGSGACESLSADKMPGSRASDQGEATAAASEQEASIPAANQVTINTKSPISADMPPEPVNISPDQPAAAPSAQPSDTGPNASTAISLPSSPAQSPEIEVADVEDMDQDPNASNWKPLEEALRDRGNDLVQLDEQLPLPDVFPRLRDNQEQRENLEEICAVLEKGTRCDSALVYAASRLTGPPGSPFDVRIFLQVKSWLETSVHSLDQINHEAFVDDRDFWEDLPTVLEALLRRW